MKITITPKGEAVIVISATELKMISDNPNSTMRYVLAGAVQPELPLENTVKPFYRGMRNKTRKMLEEIQQTFGSNVWIDVKQQKYKDILYKYQFPNPHPTYQMLIDNKAIQMKYKETEHRKQITHVMLLWS